MIDYKELEKDCRVYLALPPFNNSRNLSEGDGYFYVAMCRRYGEIEVQKEIEKLRENERER